MLFVRTDGVPVLQSDPFRVWSRARPRLSRVAVDLLSPNEDSLGTVLRCLGMNVPTGVGTGCLSHPGIPMSITSPEPLLLTVEATAVRLSLSRAKIYRLVNSGALRSVKIGHARRVPLTALTDFVERLDGTDLSERCALLVADQISGEARR